MIERIIELSARNKFLVLVLTGVALLGALWAVRHVPVEGGVSRAAVPPGSRRPDERIEDGVDRRTLIGGRGRADDVEIHRARV